MPNLYNIQDTYTIQNNMKVYDPYKCFAYLETAGKQTYGQNFKIQQDDKPVIFKLLIYAIQDEAIALKYNIDLNKGILLSGPIGCGKTSILQLIRPFLYIKNDYKIKTSREISFEFAKSGYDALIPYTHQIGNQNRLPGYCFDDLGAEQQIKHFGNDCNVMAEILLTRYDHFIQKKAITHITTNLNASEIEKHYGNRLRSRFRQMFNLITFNPTSKDKR